MIRVVLVDDHEMVVTALSQLLNLTADFEVCATFASAELAWEYLQQYPVDVVVTDLDLGGESGAQLASKILARDPGQAVIVLSYRVDLQEVSGLVKLGVKGYVPKSAPIQELTRAIRQVAAGFRHFSGAAADHWQALSGAAKLRGPLTRRQMVVLHHMSRGLTTRQIAAEVGLSVKTVEKYRGEIYQRLDCKNQTQALSVARDRKLLT